MSARVIRIAHPRNQGLVVVGLGRQDRGLPGDEFQKHDAEGVDVGPVRSVTLPVVAYSGAKYLAKNTSSYVTTTNNAFCSALVHCN